MDLEVEGSRNSEVSASTAGSSSARSGTNSRLETLRALTANFPRPPGTSSLSCLQNQIIGGSSLRTQPPPFFSRSSGDVQQSDSSDSIPQGSRSQTSTVENGILPQGRSHFSRLVDHSINLAHSINPSLPTNETFGSSPTRFVAGTDERTASRSSSQFLSTERNLRPSDNTEDSNYSSVGQPAGLSRSESISRQPSEGNSEDSSHSSSVESVRIRRVHVLRNSEQSECSTSNSENVSQPSSGRQASPRSSTSLSISLGNLGFAGSEAESTSFDNGSESGVFQNQSRSAEGEPFLIRPLSGLPPENIGFNIRQSGSQAGSEDSDVIVPNIGPGSAQRGSGVRVRRRRLFHENMNFSDESTMSSSQHNSPDDINDDINNLERSTAQLLSQDLTRERSSVGPNSPPSLSTRSYQRFFCDQVSDEPYPQSSSDAQRVRERQRHLEDSPPSWSSSWERISASFQHRSNSGIFAGKKIVFRIYYLL